MKISLLKGAIIMAFLLIDVVFASDDIYRNFRKNKEGLFLSKGDGKLTEIMDKLCARRYKDVERDSNGLVTEEGAKKFALLCFLENCADTYLGHFVNEIDESFDGYDFKLEKDEENKRITVTMQNHNRNDLEFVFAVDCIKCCILSGGSAVRNIN